MLSLGRHSSLPQPSSCVQARCVFPRPVCIPFRHQGHHLYVASTIQVLHKHASRARRLVRHAFEQGNNSSKDSSLEDYYEVLVESVRCAQGASIVNLKVLGLGTVIPVHIGEHESNALVKEINKQRQMRPLTHDVMKHLLNAIGFTVTKIRITDIISNTYYARIHIARVNKGVVESEVDVDARPSDAINLAVRFGAPMYVSRKIAETSSQQQQQQEGYTSQTETNADVVRSVREALSSYEDPTVMYQLQKELAVKEERYEEAQELQEKIFHEMTHNQMLRVVVAMESALQDGRYEEAARLRDEYKKLIAKAVSEKRI